MPVTRRSFLGTTPAMLTLATAGAETAGLAQSAPASIHPSFPSHAPDLVREFVGAAHGNVARVRELLQGRPGLAKAAWDWSFGDWETALGAASHVGHREIAELLIGNGAPVTIFSAAMMNQLAVVQAFVAASPGIHRVMGPHGIPLLLHARLGKAAEVVKYLESLGGADGRPHDEALPEAERAAILGTYSFGDGAGDRLIVLVNQRGALVIQRPGAPERNLFHQGARVFHPTGAEAVRIRFAPGTPSPEVRVEDGALTVTATRVLAR